LPLYGCIALGVVIGLAAGFLLLLTLASAAKKLRARANVFPTREIAALITLLGILTCATWARSKWFPIGDPLCGAAYFCVLMVLMGGFCFPVAPSVVRLCAEIVAGKKR